MPNESQNIPENRKDVPEISRASCPIYTTDGLNKELRQGELISRLSQYTYSPNDGEGVEVVHPFVIIVSQDCDLLWDSEAVSSGKPKTLNGVLLYEVDMWDQILIKLPAGKDIRNRIHKNNDERYHFLESVPDHLDIERQGIPDLVIDFKRYFTVPYDEIIRQISDPSASSAKRRCRLETPYREHLQTRAAFYFQRVTLPLPHESTR